jgi:hypothetical protein
VFLRLVFLFMFFRDPRGIPERDEYPRETNTRERRIPEGNQVNEYMSMVRKNMNSSINQPSTQFDGRHMI